MRKRARECEHMKQGDIYKGDADSVKRRLLYIIVSMYLLYHFIYFQSFFIIITTHIIDGSSCGKADKHTVLRV